MSGDWLDPEWGIPSGLSGFFDSRSSKLAGAPGLARGLDLMEMTKELVKEQYEAKRPDDGIEGVRTAVVIHVERKFLNQVTDPVIEDIWTQSTDVAGAQTVLVVYAAPAGGSCSMLLKPASPDDFSSIYNFPRFYGIDTTERIEDFIGRPCEVSYLDKDTLAYGLFHKMSTEANPESPKPPQDIYRKTPGLHGAKSAFNDSADAVMSVDPSSTVNYTYAMENATSAYHASVTMDATKNPYGETGGGRIKNNKELQPKDKIKLAPSYSRFGKTRWIHRDAYIAYVYMVSQATADGIAAPLLRIGSAYRSVDFQAKLWAKKVTDPESLRKAEASGLSLEAYCRKWVAPPGKSRHHSGRAVDLYLGHKNTQSNVNKLKSSPAYIWMQQNAGFFGFYNYLAEPWHWEFNPDARTQRVSDLVSLRSPKSKG